MPPPLLDRPCADGGRKIPLATRWTVAAALTVPFFCWLALRYLTLDFWSDEVCSLSYFALCPLSETVTNYQLPNNHIFFNLINNLYLRLTGIVELHQLLDAPQKIRLLMLAYTAVTLFIVCRICMRFFNFAVACLALIILVTTVPFFNFALQVRGYMLSMMLLAVFVHCAWNFEQTGSTGSGLAVAAATMLALYTIPLNLYFLMAAATFYLASGSLQLLKSKDKGPLAGSGGLSLRRELAATYRDFIVGLWLLLGFAAALTAYTPVIYSVLDNPFVDSRGWFNFHTLASVAPRTLGYFLSQRLVLLALVVPGVVHAAWSLARGRRLPFARHWACCICLLVLPFVFSFVRGDQPFLRVFVNLAPVFAIFLAITVYYGYLALQRWMQKLPAAGWVLLAALYCQVTFAAQMQSIDRRLQTDIEGGRMSQDIYYNYYQAHYRPGAVIRQFKERHFDPRTPLFAGYAYDRLALPAYSRRHQVHWRWIKFYENELFAAAPTIHILTALPYSCMRRITARHPGVDCRILNDELSFHNVLQCRLP